MNSAVPLAAELGAVNMAHLRAADASAVAGESHRSGVSWGAIAAGAAGAAAMSLILLLLGTGLGLSSVSPWTGQGVSATALGISTIVWLTFTQIAASGMGGYLAGRLRSKWAALHSDEVYFRDTAHGFLAWAVATLVTAALLTSAIGSIVGTAAQTGASVAGGVAANGAAAAVAAVDSNSDSASGGKLGYFIDALFRKDSSAPSATSTAPGAASNTPAPAMGSAMDTPAPNQNAEIARIFANDLRTGSLTAEDTKYVGQVIAQRTGLTQADAEKRVADSFAKVQTAAKGAETAARDAADKARKASSYAALWLFVSLLAGAFVASLAATFGGRLRDA